MSLNCASAASFWISKNIMAQGGNGGAPIAVPTLCKQYVSPNWKTLFFMISFNASIKTAGGTVRFFSFSRANRPMRWRVGHVWIFVYMEVSSQISKREFDGIFCLLSLFFNVNKSWKCDFCIRERGCSHSMMSWPKGWRRFPQYYTTGSVFSRTLCTLKVDTIIPMDPRSNLGFCARIFVFPFSVRPGNFLSTSPAVFAPRWHDILRPLGSDVDRSGNFRDDIW